MLTFKYEVTAGTATGIDFDEGKIAVEGLKGEQSMMVALAGLMELTDNLRLGSLLEGKVEDVDREGNDAESFRDRAADMSKGISNIKGELEIAEIHSGVG